MNAGPLLALISQSVAESWPVASQEAYRNQMLKQRGDASSNDAGTIRSGTEHAILRDIDEHFLPALDPRHPLRLSDLVDCPIHVLPTPVFGAEAVWVGGQGHVVVHQGTFTLLSFAIDMLVARGLTPPDWKPGRDAMRDYGDLVSRLYTGLCYSYLLEPFSLPALRHWFPEARRGDMVETLLFADLFVLLHEQAHIRLGHVSGEGSVREMAFGSPASHEQEHAADHDAIAHCPPFLRAGVLQGASMFFFVYGAFEAVVGRRSSEHPCAEHRLARLMRDFRDDADPGTLGFSAQVIEMLKLERENFARFDGTVSPQQRARRFLDGISPRRAVWLLQRAMRQIHAP